MTSAKFWLLSYPLLTNKTFMQSPCFRGYPVRISYEDGLQMDEMESRSSGMVDFDHDDFEDQLAMPSMSYRDRLKLTGFGSVPTHLITSSNWHNFSNETHRDLLSNMNGRVA